MQLLYLLILGDESNILSNKDICFNANYRFKHETTPNNIIKVSWEKKEILPDNFFTIKEDNKDCCIENISEIIGVNGSGKTLIFKTLFRIANNNFEENYILIYKKEEKLIGHYGFINGKGRENKRIYEFDCMKDNYCFFSQKVNDGKRIDKNQNGFDIETDLVYLCNHYCSIWKDVPLILNTRMYDYSTAGLINSDYDYSELAHGDTSRACINSHRYKELERIINLIIFLQRKVRVTKLNTKNNDYQKTINEISINKVNIEWNKDVLDSARDIISKQDTLYNIMADLFVYVKKSNLVNLFEKDELPMEADFFFMIFWCFIASCVIKHLKDSNINPEIALYFKLANYCDLAMRIKQEVKKSRKDIYDFKDEIMTKFKKYNESKDLVTFFDKAYNILRDQKKSYKEKNNLSDTDGEFNNYIEFNFLDLKSKEELFNILKLHLQIVNSYQLNNPLINIKFDPPISSGELSFLTLLSRLYDYLEKNPNSKHAIIFIDEAETTLHPEWQKALCQNTISFIEDYCEAKNRKLHIHIIFASHSPMLMSDVPTGNIVFLDKDKSSDDLNKTDWKTFAGDIFEIYQKGFFLKDGSIGNFAVTKIQEVIKHLSEGNINDDDKKIVDMIGDELISRYISKIIGNQFSNTHNSKK